jgi:hypothetical protein
MSNLIYGSGGVSGHQGTAGPGGFQITDWKEDLQKKYNNRFTIKVEYDAMTFAPNHVVIDNNTNKQYKINYTKTNPTSTSNIMNETEQFIQGLIITIRDEKITTIINGH